MSYRALITSPHFETSEGVIHLRERPCMHENSIPVLVVCMCDEINHQSCTRVIVDGLQVKQSISNVGNKSHNHSIPSELVVMVDPFLLTPRLKVPHWSARVIHMQTHTPQSTLLVKTQPWLWKHVMNKYKRLLFSLLVHTHLLAPVGYLMSQSERQTHVE